VIGSEETMHIFTYGSLMYRPVWERVVTGEYGASAATLRGFSRRRIRGELYPGLVRASTDSVVEGILYLDVSAPDVAALDHFEGEGEAYARIEVAVQLAGGGAAQAWTYLYLNLDLAEDSPWDPALFESEGMARFMDTYYRERAQRSPPGSTEKR
jgi:gamma-glutamylcyclotransferase (GGCT)/AIG2-like uncharacterized protein YtfP